MNAISSLERRELRAKAHALHPVVSIGQHGLTPAVLHEIDLNLLAHELIKIRVFNDARGERETLLARICQELDAAPVQHIGKLLVVWRRTPPQEEPPETMRAATRGTRKPGARAAGGQGMAKTAARKAPQARRPRTPGARTPARPPSATARRGVEERSRGKPRAPAATGADRQISPGARRRRRGISSG